jgi:hypothetical protein
VYQTVSRGANAEFAKWVIDRGRFEPRSAPCPDDCGGAIAIADFRETPEYRDRSSMSVKLVELGGARTYLAVPMLKDERVVGGITIYRPDVRPFTQKQIDLVSTFASQAVIAIENVRLFNETKEALERQTATAGILNVISSSPTNVQPVLDAIVQSAARLFQPCYAGIMMREGASIHLNAIAGPAEFQAKFDEMAKRSPRKFDPDHSPVSQAIAENRVIEIPDTEAPDAPEAGGESRAWAAIGPSPSFRWRARRKDSASSRLPIRRRATGWPRSSSR